MIKSKLAIIGLALCVNSSLAAAAQTCAGSINQTTPTKDFVIDKTKETVVHLTSGLMWKRCTEGLAGDTCARFSPTRFTWAEALNHVNEVNKNGGFAGYTDWRLPNIKELSSISELSCLEPAINIAAFPGTRLDSYWSSSFNGRLGYESWFVNMKNGASQSNSKSTKFFIRLVRTN